MGNGFGGIAKLVSEYLNNKDSILNFLISGR